MVLLKRLSDKDWIFELFCLYLIKIKEMYEENDPYQLPETTKEEIIDKIRAMAQEIRMDWTDPRGECREIYRLCDKLKEII
jgi:hypothetical protein